MNPELAGLLCDDDQSFEETLEIMKDDLEEGGYFIMRSPCRGCIYRLPKRNEGKPTDSKKKEDKTPTTSNLT
jgi:hypothetical protein